MFICFLSHRYNCVAATASRHWVRVCLCVCVCAQCSVLCERVGASMHLCEKMSFVECLPINLINGLEAATLTILSAPVERLWQRLR